MAFIEWTDTMSVNVPLLDEQHRGLVDIINRMYNGMEQGHGKDILVPVLVSLMRYTQEHFRTEEEYLERSDYPDLEAHKKVHLGLENQVKDLIDRVRDGQTKITLEVMVFLKNWLTNHIMNSDKAYAPAVATT